MKRIYFSLILFLSIGHVNAEERQSLRDTVQIDEVVITANKAYVNKNNVPLSISIVNRKQIENSSESALLPVLSQRVPGLFVTQRGITGFGVSTGGAGTVNIRGVGQGNKVLMLFDGQPQWAGVFGHSLPDTYVASDVERVEVVRGPGSLLYGSNAMGGVVNIITRQQNTPGVTTQLRAMYGSYNTQKYMINNGVKTGKFSSFISLNHDRTDGYRPNSKFSITNGFLNLGYQITPSIKLIGNTSVEGSNSYNPGEITKPMFDNWMLIYRGTASVALENSHKTNNGAARFFYNWGNHKINDGHTAMAPPSKFLFRSTDHNYGAMLYQSFSVLPHNQFTVGVDYKNWGGDAWNAFFSGERENVVDRDINEVGAYAIMQQSFWSKLILNAGLRYEHNNAYGGEWVPQAGIIYHPILTTTIKGSFSKGFRSPTLRELYISYLPFSKANPDLSPESMLNYEVSVGQALLDRLMYIEVTAFYIDGKNMISPVNFQLTNIGRFYNKGVEVDFNYHLNKYLTMDANYSFLQTNKPLVAAPKHKMFTSAHFTYKGFSLSANVQGIWGLYVVVPNPMKKVLAVKENYALFNARAAYRFGTEKKNITLFVKGENLTNTHYTINSGYPMPGAVVMGGVDITF